MTVKTVSHCSDWAISLDLGVPDATTISKERALNGNTDNVERQDVLRKKIRQNFNKLLSTTQ